MSRYKVVVVNTGYADYDIETKILAQTDASVIPTRTDSFTEDQVIAVAKDAHVILVREAPITRRVMDALVHLKGIVRYGVGVDNVDLAYAKERKIPVANVPGYGTEEVSDHAVALLLACIRRLRLRDLAIRAGHFETDISDKIHRTPGKVLGLVGFGRISRAVHRKWTGFLPERVLACDPFVDPGEMKAAGATPADLDTLLSQSDYISLHAPLTPETRHIIDADAISKMKRPAILVNTSRGELVDERALAAALTENRICAAGLDVFETEPPDKDNPLLELDNVILSSHAGWYSLDAVRELQTRAAQEALRILKGQRPESWVNPW